eukprot:10343132-Alexandrium_andersonii.AAC.1
MVDFTMCVWRVFDGRDSKIEEASGETRARIKQMMKHQTKPGSLVGATEKHSKKSAFGLLAVKM